MTDTFATPQRAAQAFHRHRDTLLVKRFNFSCATSDIISAH
jgi:hypothetical protein